MFAANEIYTLPASETRPMTKWSKAELIERLNAYEVCKMRRQARGGLAIDAVEMAVVQQQQHLKLAMMAELSSR